MNTKRLLLSCVVAFVFMCAFDFVFHGILLKGTYAATANLWRSETEMMRHMGWLIAGQLFPGPTSLTAGQNA